MARVRAAVLAAGRGVRMGGAAPKSLLPLGDHEPLLHYLLTGLERAGIEDLLVVTGFQPAKVMAFVTERWEGEAAFVRNARYASWGNFHSVRMAIDQSPGRDLLVVNSDIVVHPDAYKRVLATYGDLVLAVQLRSDLEPEDMRVRVENDLVRGVSKDLDMKSSAGEFAGVSLLRPLAATAYARVASDLEWRAETHGYYEDIYNTLLTETGNELIYGVRYAEVGPDEYAEVDEPADMESAVAILERHRDVFGLTTHAEGEEPLQTPSSQPEEVQRP